MSEVFCPVCGGNVLRTRCFESVALDQDGNSQWVCNTKADNQRFGEAIADLVKSLNSLNSTGRKP